MTTDLNYNEAARAIMIAGERLAGLLSMIEDFPLHMDDVMLNLGAMEQPFDACCGIDVERMGGVVITINPEVVRRFDGLMHAAGLVTAKLEAGSGRGAPGDIEPFVEAALQWMMLHELGHWLCGHLGYIAAVERLEARDVQLNAVSNYISAVGPAKASRLSPGTYRCFELQADFFAMQFLDIAFEGDHLGDAEVHARAAPLGRQPEDGMPRIPWSRRFAGIAAGAVVLIMEHIRKNTREYDGERHPSPEARAIAIMAVLIGHSIRDLGYISDGEIRIRATDDEQFISIFKALLKDAASIFHTDLSHLSEVLDVEPIFSRNRLIETEFLGEKIESTASISDLFVHMMEPEAGEHRFFTDGGKELARLRQLERRLRAELEPFAIWT